MTIFWAIVALGILITVHELGHFTAAKLSGVYVERFSIGFGPALFSFEKNGTVYSVSLIPLGGYVKLYRMFEDEERLDDETPAMVAGSFYDKPLFKKIFIITAGVLCNLIFAFVLFCGVYATGYRAYSPIVGTVSGMAAEAGFKPYDRILSVDDKKIESWEQFSADLMINKISQVKLLRDSDELTIPFTPAEKHEVNPKTGVDYTYADTGMMVYIAPVVGSLAQGLPAQKAGIMPGDRIKAINGNEVKQWTDINGLVNAVADGEELTVTVYRGNDIQSFTFIPNMNEETKRKMIGVSAGAGDIRVRADFKTAMKDAVMNTYYVTALIYKSVGQMVTGKASREEIGGPIMIVQATSQSVSMGFDFYLMFVAMISINLAVLNLLPLPVLDGGYVILYIYEAIARKRLSVKVRNVFQQIGVTFLLALMVFALFNDITRIIK